jgi:hypothetical protein
MRRTATTAFVGRMLENQNFKRLLADWGDQCVSGLARIVICLVSLRPRVSVIAPKVGSTNLVKSPQIGSCAVS